VLINAEKHFCLVRILKICVYLRPNFFTPFSESRSIHPKKAPALLRVFFRCRDRKPACPVHFREILLFPRTGRPFHGKGVAPDRGGVAVAFQGPRGNDFPLGCFLGVRGIKSPSAWKPVSSWNSLLATSNGSSPGAYSPWESTKPLILLGPERAPG